MSSGPCTAVGSTTRSSSLFTAAAAQAPALVLWESYSTWLSGFALFTVSYLYSASTYLIDKSKMDWRPATAIIVALGFFVVFWLLYDAICRIFGQRKNGDAIVGALVFVLVCILVAGLPLVLQAARPFAGGRDDRHGHERQRVLLIIPGQRTVVAQIKAGSQWTPSTASAASSAACTTPTTLPVLFAMLSNHYSFTWNHPQTGWCSS